MNIGYTNIWTFFCLFFFFYFLFVFKENGNDEINGFHTGNIQHLLTEQLVPNRL